MKIFIVVLAVATILSLFSDWKRYRQKSTTKKETG